MALLSKHSNIQIDLATGTRRWEGDAVVQDTAAGSSVVVTLTHTTTGVTPPQPPDGFELSVRLDNVATQVRLFTLNASSASQTVTFFFTSDGTSGGTALAGTVRMRLRAFRNTGLGANQYDVTSDNGQFGSAANVYPTGGSLGAADWGYLRGTDASITEDFSNTSLGGAPVAPAEYDESLFVRTTSGVGSFTARALTVALSAGSVSGSTNSTTSATRDVTFANVVDDRFPAASTSVGVTVTVPNAALTGLPDWTITATTDDTLIVDPRLTQALHFQVDDNVWGLSKHDSTKQMLSTQSGFLWAKFTAARGTLKSGITANLSLDPALPGSTVGPTSFVSDANGVAGPLEWTASKPGGSWAWTADITAPSDIDADTHLLTPTDTVTMLVVDPRLKPIISLSPTAAIEARHLEPGDNMKVAVCVRNSATRKRVALDAAPTAIIERYDRVAGWQYLASDGTTWTAWSTAAADQHTLVQETDTLSYALTFSSTSGWTTTDIVGVDVVCVVGGSPYPEYVQRELVASGNRHDGYALDAVQLALSGTLGTR